MDRIGIFADILNTLTSQMLKVESVNTKSTRNKLYLNFEISGINGAGQQEELVKKLKAIRNVVSVRHQFCQATWNTKGSPWTSSRKTR